MKRIFKYGLLTFFSVTLAFVACTPDEDDVRLDPQMATMSATNITSESAVITGYVIAEGDGFTEKGVCYDISTEPTVDDLTVIVPDSLATNAQYSVTITGLDYMTKYYARAYAKGAGTVVYGDTVSFTTLPVIPELTTDDVTDLTGNTATGGGNVTSDGGAAVSMKGVCWSESNNPTVSDNHTEDGTDLGAFTSSITGLNPNTTYYVRAYATNSAGTGYGNEVEFTTTDAPAITTFFVVGDYNSWDNSDAAEIIQSLEGEATAEGYVYLTSGGIKLTTDHSWGDEATFGDDGSGALTNPGNNITVAEDGYYLIKANKIDMTYSLTRLEWGVVGSATAGGWDTDTPLEYNADSMILIGGVHFTAGEFKFRANNSWDYNYGSTDLVNLVAGGDNIAITVEDDYAVTLNLSTPNTYTYAIHTWGLIGAATPGGWDNDTNMAWDAVNKVFTLTVDLVVGEFKFRADDDWAVNFGGDIGAMTQDGANLSVASDGNYTLTLNPWTGVGTITQN